MKICVFIAREELRKSAGVRVRYDRLAKALLAKDNSLELLPIGEFTRGKPGADVYLFSKTYDVRAPLIAQYLRSHGARVGADYFDDYYSQGTDSRFVHLRRWFRYLVPTIDFALCSTTTMADRLSRLAPGLACHILNDPFGNFDASLIGPTVARNAARARAERTLHIGWFGIGANTYFDVGLKDVCDFGGQLARARSFGYEPRLEILTNLAVLKTERLEMLARLPVPVTVREWSEERERALIARSIACFLPVNAQSFSTVKSLNRGVTALTGGAQLLSAGYPLYDALEPFVYHDIGDLIRDLDNGSLRLREETTDSLVALLRDKADPSAEARGLLQCLRNLPRREGGPPFGEANPVAVIHGASSNVEIHKSVQRMHWLSVASPFFQAKLNFDVREISGASADADARIELSERAYQRLRPELASQAEPLEGQEGKPRFTLVLPMEPSFARDQQNNGALVTLDRLVDYAGAIGRMRDIVGRLFETPEVYLSELRSPYWIPDQPEPGAKTLAATGA